MQHLRRRKYRVEKSTCKVDEDSSNVKLDGFYDQTATLTEPFFLLAPMREEECLWPNGRADRAALECLQERNESRMKSNHWNESKCANNQTVIYFTCVSLV